MMSISAIIFDWGRTLYDRDNERLFPETVEVLEYCSKKYTLAIVSIAADGGIEDRFKTLDACDVRKYFAFALYHDSDKEVLYRNALGNLHLPPQETLVVDDRMVRLVWPIAHGCQTIWIEQGKFAEEKPSTLTGQPGTIVKTLRDILTLV